MIDIEKVKKALREVCQSSHCVSESLRKDLKPFEVTERKSIVFEAITELEHLQKKEIPMKPILYQYGGYQCPNCKGLKTEEYESDGSEHKRERCGECGQKLDWSEEK